MAKTDEAARIRQETEEQNRKAMERTENTQPTPTQDENDRARLGTLDIDRKESDGAEEDPAAGPQNRAMDTSGTRARR